MLISKFRMIHTKFQKGVSLLEVLVILAITGSMLAIVVFGITRFRQTIIISNTAKELVLNIRKARRYSINNVITSSGYSPAGYYVRIVGDEYYFGECYSSGGILECDDKSVKSVEYTGIKVSLCDDTYGIIKFSQVTGEFEFYENLIELINSPGSGVKSATCIIEIDHMSPTGVAKEIEVSGTNRTMKIL